MTRLAHRLASRGLGLFEGRTAKGAVGSFALRVGSTALGFITSILLARLLGAEGYGVYSYAFAWTNLLVIPAALGLNELLVREVAAYSAQSAWGKIKALLRWSNGVVVLLSVAVAVIAAAIFWKVLGSGITFYALVIALISLPLVTLTSLRQGALRGFRRVVIGQLPEMLLRPLLMILLVLGAFVVLGKGFNALWAVAVSALATCVAFAVGAWLLQRVMPTSVHQALPEYRVKKWLRSAFPFLLISGMLVINNRTDIIMLGVLQDQTSVGIYSVVVKGAGLITFVIAAVNTALAPSISSLFATGNTKKLEFAMRRSTLLIAFFSLPITLGLIIFGKPILSIFGQGFTQGYLALVILSLGKFVDVATGSVGQFLNMTGHARDTAIAVGVSAGLNILLNALLIPRWDLVGASTATACSAVIWNILLATFVYRRFGFYSMLGIITFRRAA